MPSMVRLDERERKRAQRWLKQRDPRLAAVITAVGPCGLVPRGRPYEMLLCSIIHQQLAGTAARSIEKRFKAEFEGRWPKAPVLLEISPAILRKIGLSRQKIAAILGLAEAVTLGQLRPRQLFYLSDELVIERLTELRGVGVWTAHMILMFSLGRRDVLPVGDFGVCKGAQRLYALNAPPKPAELEALAEDWRPYRSVASWYLWRAAEGIGVQALDAG